MNNYGIYISLVLKINLKNAWASVFSERSIHTTVVSVNSHLEYKKVGWLLFWDGRLF